MVKGKFSVVVALYEVQDYVETFLRSLLRQTYPFRQLEVVIVDDGSTDRSYEIVKRWAQNYPDVIRHTTKVNGGPASARNVGISMASNEWITFCDPDDALQSDYFERVADFLSRDVNKVASMLTARVMIWQEETSKISDTHPLGAKYRTGDKLIDLNADPNYVQLGGASTFLRRSVLAKHNLEFDDRIRPTFEDAELIGRYLGTFSRPIVGLVSSARYLYRKRGDGSSLVQSSWGRLERYDEVLRFGYLGMLQGLQNTLGHVPVWAQNMVLYDVQWYLTEDKKMHSASAWLPKESLAVFHDLLQRIFSLIDVEAIEQYNLTSMSWLTRQAMLVHFKGRGSRLRSVVIWTKPTARQMKIGYAFSGPLPLEEIFVDGHKQVPVKSKTVSHSYYGQIFFYERMLWTSGNGTPMVRLDNTPAPIKPPRPQAWNPKRDHSTALVLLPGKRPRTLGQKVTKKVPAVAKIPVIPRSLSKLERLGQKVENRIRIEQLVSASSAPQAALAIGRRVLARKSQAKQAERAKAIDAQTVAFAKSELSRVKYRDAWLVMDRPGSADDNGEHLYRYLMRERPDINAWFLLDRTSPDWKRLEAEGFRLVQTDSDDAVALALNAMYKISSDATFDVQFPVSPARFGAGRGKIIFLQHGVTKDDLSRWLNPKPISMIATATVKEYESIAADDSPYRYTSSETKLTGFPRYDELIRKSNLSPLSQRRYLLVMPTWRQDLRTELESCRTHQERLQVFESSQYGRNWLEVLRSEALEKTASNAGLEVLYVLHPSLASLIADIELPPHVRTVNSTDVSFQDIFVNTRVLVTDYSSVAFDVALIGGGVIYYQFDAEDIFNGRHNYRKGYYDYETDGFGPVAYDLVSMLGQLFDSMNSNFKSLDIYEARVKESFAFIDTDNCKRVVDAILSL